MPGIFITAMKKFDMNCVVDPALKANGV